MIDWQVQKENITKDYLKSERFIEFLRNLARSVSFPFMLKNGEQIVFRDQEFFPHYSRSLNISEKIVLTCEIGEIDANQARAFCLVLEELIRSQLNSEYEIQSLSVELLERYEELNLLYDFSQTIGMLTSTKKIFEMILEKVVSMLDVERASIMLYDEKNHALEVVATKGYDIKSLESPRVSLEKSISGYVISKEEPLLIDDISSLPMELELKRSSEYSGQGFITVPMIISLMKVKNKKLGVINVTEKKNNKTFSSGDLKLLNSIASMAAVAIYNNRLLEKVLESERLKRDLEIAEKIQLQMLPTRFPKAEDIELYGLCRSAKNVGGDYFDFFLHPKNHLDLLIADVSGHNVGAALMMANTRSVLRSLLHEALSVNEILRKANQLLFEDMARSGFFISVFLLRYYRDKRSFEFANGGHHPALWYRPKEKAFQKLDADGMLLGILPDVEFERKSGSLKAGDTLILFTDGVLEAVNRQEEFYGLARLKKAIARAGNRSPREMVDVIFDDLARFSGRVSQRDDITLQILRIKNDYGEAADA